MFLRVRKEEDLVDFDLSWVREIGFAFCFRCGWFLLLFLQARAFLAQDIGYLGRFKCGKGITSLYGQHGMQAMT